MTALRRLPRHHRVLTAWLVATTLFVKLLVPAGYMISAPAGTVMLELCPGVAPQVMAIAMPGMAHDPKAPKDGHGKVEQPCPFAGLSAPSLATADPILLALAIAFVVAMGSRVVAGPPVAAPPYLRPPLRGPPATS